jgi:hypothetical protein
MRMIFGAIDGMKIGRGNRSTQIVTGSTWTFVLVFKLRTIVWEFQTVNLLSTKVETLYMLIVQ